MPKCRSLVLLALWATIATAQVPVSVGQGSYASFAPLSESRTATRGGSQAYQMEHRRLYLPDSLLARLGEPDGSRQGTLALPSNDWWTYALVNPWSGKIWSYPQWQEMKNSSVSIGYPSYWESTGCEMKWDTPLSISFQGLQASECVVDSWGDYHVSFLMTDGDNYVRMTCLHGSPLTWIEVKGATPVVTNPDLARFAVFTREAADMTYVTVGLLTDGLTETDLAPYKDAIPHRSTVSYSYNATASTLTTVFSTDVATIQGFLPHHYYDTQLDFTLSNTTFATPRGQMRLARAQRYAITYPVHTMLPFFPAPAEDLEGYSPERMKALCEQYAQLGSFGADTYWGGKGLTQMMHYMTAALQLGDTAVYRQSKERLKTVLADWLTYTPGESQYYFAFYPRWGALVGFDPSYDSDTFNDHHFHYGYFVYSAAVLCMLDEDFKNQYGPMIKEVARDYANWLPLNTPGHPNQPRFRTLDPYCGHSFAGGLGNEGNGNGQESSSEAMQSWGGIWMLGAALNDADMLAAGIFGYTLEARATAEYWFDRQRRNIDYTKYQHPYCCNLTMQGVGWWTWFSGDPVWMHSIQWLPISPVLQNYLTEDRDFARWDYTEMYAHKEVGDYEAAENGLGDESGLGNVCLSYLALFDPDSAARVWDRMDAIGKALARNADTGGITYWLAHGLRSYGHQRHDIAADYPLAAAYGTEADNGGVTYAVFNATNSTKTVHFSDNTQLVAQPHKLTVLKNGQTTVVEPIADEPEHELDPIAAAWTHAYPNIALHKPVTASSYENAGTVPVHLTDGDLTTRWGSTHYDNEWAEVDLGDQYYIHYLTLRWETAYASRYEIAVSADGVSWQTLILSGSGGVEDVAVELRGRYIRLTGLTRATTYGTSLYELEAYGLPINGDPSQVIALEITSDDISLVPSQVPTYEVKAYNCLGNEMAVTQMLATDVTETLYTLTATYNDLRAIYTWPILEQIYVASIAVTPDEVSLPIGDMQTFTVDALDQFGFSLGSYDQDYYATDMVDTTLWFANPLTAEPNAVSALVHTVGYAGYNLALNKPASCSGTENETVNGAEKAVDGKLNTRWSSRFQDNEWMMVDLLDEYYIDSIVIRWEAAYATSYDINILSNPEDLTSINYQLSIENAEGGNVTHLIPEGTIARAVQIYCKTRNTGYGSSIYELEVYGSGRVHPLEPPSGVERVDSRESKVDSRKFLRNGVLYIIRGNRVYNAVGVRIK